jgi:hypothetical protein
MFAICLIATLPKYDNEKKLPPDKLEPLAMLRNLSHEQGEVRTYTFLRNVVRQRLRLCTPAGLSRPCTYDKERACSVTMPNRAPVGCAPGPCRPGPALKGALLPRAPQRQGFRAPTPTASVSTLDPDDGRACPSTQPRLCQTVGAHSNPARIGYAPGPFSPGPGLRRALPLRDLPRPGFRALTSTASVFPLAQDEQFYCSRAG